MRQEETADRTASGRTRAAFMGSFGLRGITQTLPRAAAISGPLVPHTEKQGKPQPQEDKADKDKDK
jgi:hypothetical protein